MNESYITAAPPGGHHEHPAPAPRSSPAPPAASAAPWPSGWPPTATPSSCTTPATSSAPTETVEAITAAGGPAVAVRGDVADEQRVAALFDTAERGLRRRRRRRAHGRDHALAPLVELDLDDLDRMLRTNVRGTFVVAQQAARRVRRGGAIVNFSSTVVRLALPAYGAYAATKGAVEALTLILARSCAAATSPSTPSRPAPPPPRCSSTARTRRPSPAWPRRRRWSASAPRRTSPSAVAFLAGPAAAGSTARCCAPTAVSPDITRRYDVM